MRTQKFYDSKEDEFTSEEDCRSSMRDYTRRLNGRYMLHAVMLQSGQNAAPCRKWCSAFLDVKKRANLGLRHRHWTSLREVTSSEMFWCMENKSGSLKPRDGKKKVGGGHRRMSE